jgi:MoxR-like ATPase
MVLATQNPLESYGTFPLPEAQIDRFFMRLSLGYMTREEEISVLSRPSTQAVLDELSCVVDSEETAYLKNSFSQVHVSPDVANYLMDIIDKTRQANRLINGVSTRGAIALYKASQVTAAFAGRDFVLPEDVLYVAPYVLAHRINANSDTQQEGNEFLTKLIQEVPVPLETI